VTASTKHPSERFLRFSRRSMIATLFVVAVLGATGLSLTLSPRGAVADPSNLVWWLLPVVVAALVAVITSVQGRRWDLDAPEVSVIQDDEWRRTNLNRAFQGALIVVLVAEWPLGLLLGLSARAEPVRIAMAMATATITLGLAALITLFLYFDRG